MTVLLLLVSVGLFAHWLFAGMYGAALGAFCVIALILVIWSLQ